jgi:hypothetical protein
MAGHLLECCDAPAVAARGQILPPSLVPGGDGICSDSGHRRPRNPIVLVRADPAISIALPSMTPSNHMHRGPSSALHAKNDVHDALHFTEPLRVQFVGYLDVFVVGSGDFERKACGCEFD